MDGGEGFAFPETLASVFGEGNCDIRVEKTDEFVDVSFDMGAEMVREILLNNCPNKHDGGHERADISPELSHCHWGHGFLCREVRKGRAEKWGLNKKEGDDGDLLQSEKSLFKKMKDSAFSSLHRISNIQLSLF